MNKILLLLVLACGQVQAQTDTAKLKPLISYSSFDTGTGYFDSTAEVTIWNSGKIEIKGDSLAAIKMLFKALRESSKREMELEQKIFKAQDALMGLANDWKKANEQLKKELEKIKPKL